MTDTYSVRCDCCGAESDYSTRREADAEVRRIHKAHAGVTLAPGTTLTPDRLAAAMNDAQIGSTEIALGRDLRAVAVRILDALGATLDPQPCNHDWQPWLANTSQCSCCGARRDDLAPRPVEWSCNDPFHGALLDPLLHDSCAIPAPDTALREALYAALEMVDLTAAQLRAALATEPQP